MSKTTDYHTCPACGGDSGFKELSLDLVVSEPVRIYRDGEVDSDESEINGYLTGNQNAAIKALYICVDCKTSYRILKNGSLKETKTPSWLKGHI